MLSFHFLYFSHSYIHNFLLIKTCLISELHEHLIKLERDWTSKQKMVESKFIQIAKTAKTEDQKPRKRRKTSKKENEGSDDYSCLAAQLQIDYFIKVLSVHWNNHIKRLLVKLLIFLSPGLRRLERYSRNIT